jgi:hypothetical protein
LLATLLLAALPTGTFYAQGGSAASFLRRPVLSREIALGGAFSPFAPEASALFSNSSALPLLPHPIASVSYSRLPFGDHSALLGLGTAIGEFAGIGFSIRSYGVNDIPVRDGSGRRLGTTLDNQELALSAGGGLMVGPGTIGAAVHYIRRDITGLDSSSNGYSIDLSGTLSFRDRLYFGFSLNNIAGEMRATYDQSIRELIPWDARIGVSYLYPLEEETRPARLDPSGIPSARHGMPGSYLLGLSEVHLSADTAIYVLAVEALPLPNIGVGLRAGWNSLGDLSAGFFLNIPMEFTPRLDYAVRRDYELGDITHHVTLTAAF